tara:strand:+ start:66 stop:485 length:420 start_codon:yes stop_codon:yes gene_type:complete
MIINNLVECEQQAILVSKKIKAGDVVSFEGDLGVGKTTFIKGILKGLGYKDQVTSPTFTLVNEYYANCKVIHIDFYREKNINRWINLGLNEYMDSNNIVLIEWGNLIPELLPKDTIFIKLEHLSFSKRKITSSHELFSN